MKKALLICLAVCAGGLLIMGCSKKDATTVNTNSAPQAVTLKVTDSTAAAIDLSWTRNGDNDFACYRLYRANGYANYLVKTISVQGDTSYKDSLLSPSHNYTYFVAVVDSGNLASQSNLLPASTLGIADLTLGMDPRYLETASGRTFAMEVWVEDVDSLFGASFELCYDSTSLVADSARAGSFLGSDVIFFSHTASGLASVSVTLLSGAVEVSGSGSLAVVYFHSTGTGTKDITFSPIVALQKSNGSDITGFSTLAKWTANLIIQ